MMQAFPQAPSFAFDQQYADPVIGLDEVGYGPWAGPVLCAAVLVKNRAAVQCLEGEVRDSKKLSPKKREYLFEALTQSPHVVWAVGQAEVDEIDRLNIRNATIQAMQRAITHGAFGAGSTLLIDGTLKFVQPDTTVVSVIKGDSLSFSIAAASIIAKVMRDRLMAKLHLDYPVYGWDKNVGYGTKVHQEGLQRHGPCQHHRKSYAPIAKLL